MRATMWRFILASAATIVVFTGVAHAAEGDKKKPRICVVNEAVENEQQLNNRLSNCRKGEVALIDVSVLDVEAAEVAARACDFNRQILVEPATASSGLGRVTCVYNGDVVTRER